MKFRSAGLLTLAHASADINQGAIPALLPFFIDTHHLSYAAAASIVFAVNMVSTVAQPFFGLLSDRRPRPWLIPVYMVVIGLGVSYTGFAPTYGIGLAAVMVTGLGIAGFHPEGARLMNHLAGSQKATAMSLFGIGGQLGFAIGPLIATAALVWWGMKGTAILIVPPAIVAAYVAFTLPTLTKGYATEKASTGIDTEPVERDLWCPFLCLAAALLVRSVIFYGLNTFLLLFWINVLHQTKAAGGVALTVLLGSLVVGNFFGGRTAERVGYRAMAVIALGVLSCLLPLLLLAQSPALATLLLIPIGLALAAPFGPMVALGQSYLPNRVGLASGITMGLAFSFGGLATPFLGWIGDHYGLRTTIGVVAFLPLVCTALALTLPKVGRASTR